LMVLSTSCRYCTESASFYQTLAREKSERGGARLIAVLPQNVSESQKYLNDHGITVDAIRQANPGTLQASGTPTLIMTDQTGTVITSWVGKLTPPKEVEVLNRLLIETPGD